MTLSCEIDGEWENVSKTKTPVKFRFKIPNEFLNKGSDFFFLRMHDGEATLLYDQDTDPKTITVESDRFSTYAMLYSAKEGAAGVGTSGITNSLVAGLGGIRTVIFVTVILILLLFTVAIFLLVYLIWNRKLEGEYKLGSSIKIIYANNDYDFDAKFVERDEFDVGYGRADPDYDEIDFDEEDDDIYYDDDDASYDEEYDDYDNDYDDDYDDDYN